MVSAPEAVATSSTSKSSKAKKRKHVPVGAPTLYISTYRIWKEHGESVAAMAMHPESRKLAVVYRASNGGDDVVELWNLLILENPRRERVITPVNGSIEGVCWVNKDRCLLAHSNGSISVIEAHTPSLLRVQISATPLVVVARVDDERALLASHSSHVFLVNAVDGRILKQVTIGVDIRLLSAAVQPVQDSSKPVISAVGAVDRIYLLRNLEVRAEITVERKERRLPTLIWTLCFISNKVLASGDSRGIVTFWNYHDTTILATSHYQQADVLALTFSPATRRLYASGVDPRIVEFGEGRPGQDDWRYFVASETKLIRDIKAIVPVGGADGALVVAGVDHSIAYCSGTKEKNKIKKFKRLDTCQSDRFLIGGDRVVVLERKFAEIWSAATLPENENAFDRLISESQTYLFKIVPDDKATITNASLSDDGKMLALVTNLGTNVYMLGDPKDKEPVQLMRSVEAQATAIVVTAKNLWYTVGDFELRCVSIESAEDRLIVSQEGVGLATRLVVEETLGAAAVITSRLQTFVISIKGEIRCEPVQSSSMPVDVCFAGSRLVIAQSSPKLAVVALSLTDLKPVFAVSRVDMFPFAEGAMRDLNRLEAERRRPDRPLAERVLVSAGNLTCIINVSTRELSPHIHLHMGKAETAMAIHFHPLSTPDCERLFVAHLDASMPGQDPFKLSKFGAK